jgi:hypothetical protein
LDQPRGGFQDGELIARRAGRLDFGRLLPVFAWKRTSSGPVGMSQKCQ